MEVCFLEWGCPKMDGLFHGKSYILKYLGVPPWIGNLHISLYHIIKHYYTNFHHNHRINQNGIIMIVMVVVILLLLLLLIIIIIVNTPEII